MRSRTLRKSPRRSWSAVSRENQTSTRFSQEGARGHKVQMEPRMPAEPPLNRRMCVRRVVVEDGVDSHVRRRLCVEQVQELAKFLMPMARQTRADDGALEDIQRGKQRRRPVPLVVVGHGAGSAGFHRQAGLRSLQRLDLALFVDTEDQGLFGRIHVEPDDVGELLEKPRVRRQLEGTDAVRLQPVRLPNPMNRRGFFDGEEDGPSIGPRD